MENIKEQCFIEPTWNPRGDVASVFRNSILVTSMALRVVHEALPEVAEGLFKNQITSIQWPSIRIPLMDRCLRTLLSAVDMMSLGFIVCSELKFLNIRGTATVNSTE
jgi:hypothetical protein